MQALEYYSNALRMCRAGRQHITVSTWYLLTIVNVVGLLHTLDCQAAPCLLPRATTAFVQGVIDGLPAEMQRTFCNETTSSFHVRPEDLGVQQFVLSGHIPRHLVGKQGNEWHLVQHVQSSSRESDALPAMLHLWIKALCSG